MSNGLNYRDLLEIWEYDLEGNAQANPAEGGTAKYELHPKTPIFRTDDLSLSYDNRDINLRNIHAYVTADYKVSGSKPSQTIIRAEGTQQALSTLTDVSQRTLTLPMMFISWQDHSLDTLQVSRAISAFTRRLMTGEVRIWLPDWTYFVGALTDVSEPERIDWLGTQQLVTFELTGYHSEGLFSGYHTLYSSTKIEGTAPRIPVRIDYKINSNSQEAWVCGVHLHDIGSYGYIRFDGIKKKLLVGAEDPFAFGHKHIIWTNALPLSDGLISFPYVESGHEYLINEFPAVGNQSSGGQLTKNVTTAWTIYDAILI